jgi:hypothetical protein
MNHITQAKRKDEAAKNVLERVIFYDKTGVDFLEEYKRDEKNNLVSVRDHERYAKAELYTDGEKRYYIKRYRGGRVGEYIVDPASILGSEKDLVGYNDKFGERFAEYVKVDANTFVTYTGYLQHRNPIFFKNVERKFLDGDLS